MHELTLAGNTIKQLTGEQCELWTATLTDPKDIKFGKKALGFWTRFAMFEKNAPYGLFVEDQLVSVCYITVSPKRSYCNLYYILTHSDHKRKGYGGKLFQMLKHLFTLKMTPPIKRIKLSSEIEALPFWLAMGFYFWGYDKYGSLKADIPLILLKPGAIGFRNAVRENPAAYLPPEPIVSADIPREKVQKAIDLAFPYYFHYSDYVKTLDAFTSPK